MTKPSNIYFIGIGGIGMSAIARYYNVQGVKVSGYDKTETTLTKQLQQEGIEIHFEDNIDLMPKQVDFVIYTPAIPKDHTELNYYVNNNYTVYKRSDVLKIITENSFNICVAGTHGKTTTSTIIGHLLRDSNYGCNAFLGGIAANYNTNFWSSKENNVVVEADEYDKSFFKLSPNIAIITAVDADHLDIYGTAEEVENAFVEFSQKIKEGGCLLLKHGLHIREKFTTPDLCTYSVSDVNANIHIQNLQVINGSYHFDVINNYWTIKDVVLNMGGLHNIENALAAIGVAKYLKIEDEKIKSALANFKGVKRRFEYIVKNDEHILIDDYAHHPDELKALINGVRSIYTNEKLTIVFQPHLYTRTRDFVYGFAASLDMADEVILLPIYPARELPIEGISSEIILNKMNLANKQVLSKESMMNYINENKPKLIVMAGAGDIDVLVYKVCESLNY
ncbi:MAG: UDP-N-acetylmuramate--L-alanine ligase [Bacteroidetes bacterium]|nr:UDP-N-acetylmuramate--L-alanine ligase [Bacteroidota bacterium]